MAFRVRSQKTDRNEVELMRGLITLANELQASLELNDIVGVIVTLICRTFAFREAALYLIEPDGETFRVHATAGEHPEYDSVLFDRPIPRRVLDELFVPRYQVGSSFFVDSTHTWTDEQLYYLPPLDLGPRDPHEWQSDDELFVPLFDKRREMVGVLDLFDPRDRQAPSLDLVKSLEVFVAHAAVAIENARQFKALEDATAQLAAQLELRHGLIELSAALLTTLDQRQLFARVGALLKDFVDYDAMEIRLVDEAARELYCAFASDRELEQMTSWRAPLDVGVSGWVVSHNEAQLVNDMLSDPRGALVPGTEWVPQASIVAPLAVGGTVMGVLALDRMGERTFSEAELESAKLFANLTAIAIRNARQYEEAQTVSHQLERQLALRHRLLDVSTTLLGTLDREAVLREIGTMLREVVEYDSLDIRLVDKGTRELISIYATGEDAADLLALRLSMEGSLRGWVAQHGSAQIVNDGSADPRVAHANGEGERRPHASLVVPLRLRGTTTGVLAVERLRGRTFEEQELEVAQLFANMAAIAIQNAHVYEELEHRAITDGLTGLHNHRHFHDTLDLASRRAERYGESFCLLMLDLDHFKAVNDTVGHQKGDEVLRAVSDVLRSCSRETDYLARYGGEEFAVILPRTYLQEAVSLAHRIRGGVAEIDIGHPGLRVSVSAGVAAYPESAETSEGLLAAADGALLRAKALGRDRVCLAGAGPAAPAEDLEGGLAALGRRFADFIGLDEAETVGLITALAAVESDGGLQAEVQGILGSARNGDALPADVRSRVVDALIYGSERWDGLGYPEGRRGSAIPRVARAFAVCRRFDFSAQNGDSLDELRLVAARELDPVMVQRFAAMVRAEKPQHN
jgi:diguanylate cyclase (GGDEF)-like protein